MISTMTDTDLRKELQHKIDSKTKPLEALGRLEEVALQVGLIQGSVSPQITSPHIVVFAGDHGIAATGLVNPYPQAVTAQMVLNFIAGGAAINVFCRQQQIGLTVVDAGVNFDFPAELSSKSLIRAKTGYGTRNYLEGEAMSRDEAGQAMEAGEKIVEDLFREGCNCIGFGEMGIGNTSSASLIMSFITGIPIEECTGRGTGVNDGQLEKKIATLRDAFRIHLPAVTGSLTDPPNESSASSAHALANSSDGSPTSSPASSPDPLTILQRVGGFEIAMMTGAYRAAAELKMIILVDGFITTAALLLAQSFNRQVQRFCIFSHTSGEQGHEKMLQYLGARPLLNLGMRLGEGTGAAMALPLVQSAVHFLREMASFESAGVSQSGE